jgi:hypothetical protein
MSETRRQLFKKSVFSAVGFAALPAIAACTSDGQHPFWGSGHPLNSDPWGPIAGHASDGRWYLFVLKSISVGTQNYTYAVYVALRNPPSSPMTVKFDVNDWYNDLKANSGLAPATLPFTIDGTTYTPNNGTVVANPLHNDAVQIAAKWNEIGKQ